jgi:uncharacterized protein YndB with AHSA1/START domain
MNESSTRHATFVIERTYPASPARVFRAWSDRAAKSRWFACHDDWKAERHEMDFRVGGREQVDTRTSDGHLHRFDARYHDIVPDARIVFTYDMYVGERRISVSLTTIELAAVGGGTRMTFTEQGVFLDGRADPAEREEGTRAGLANLETEVRR